MAGNLIDLRRRIGSVRNTQKITRAMKTVSAAKLRRSVGDLNRTRAVTDQVRALLGRIAPAVSLDGFDLLRPRADGPALCLLVTADKGLCGSYNTQLLRLADQALEQAAPGTLSFVGVGNKGLRHLRKKQAPVVAEFPNLFARHLSAEEVSQVAGKVLELYLEGGFSRVEVVASSYQSSGQQAPGRTTLLPLQLDWDSAGTSGADAERWIFEPDRETVFQALLPRYFQGRIQQILLEAMASEHTARMMAMELATRNATDMIHSLTLTLNKLRQASITGELLEIITATEALNH